MAQFIQRKYVLLGGNHTFSFISYMQTQFNKGLEGTGDEAVGLENTEDDVEEPEEEEEG